MDQLQADLFNLTRLGNWDEALSILRVRPSMVNVATDAKGYAPLHQAAWHGADLVIVGELLALGADRSLRTFNKRQTAADIAGEKHPEREDLAFLLHDAPRTAAQLMRKMRSDDPALFGGHDGNDVLFEHIVGCLGADLFDDCLAEPEIRLHSAYHAVVGQMLVPGRDLHLAHGPWLEFKIDADLWLGRISYKFGCLAQDRNRIPLERPWAVIGDLFLPPNVTWGFRGDPYLWMEMQKALCHAPIPEDCNQLERMLSAMFYALIGVETSTCGPNYFARFAHGGMSGGQISCQTWRETLIPLLLRRADWLHQSWRKVNE